MIAQKKKVTMRELLMIAAGNMPEWWTSVELAMLTDKGVSVWTSTLHRMILTKELERRPIVRSHDSCPYFEYRVTKLLGKVKRMNHRIEPVVDDNGAENIFREIIRKGHDEDFKDKLPMFATAALPGSQEKVEIMRQRVERGESPNHPDDLRHGRQLGKIPNLRFKPQ